MHQAPVLGTPGPGPWMFHFYKGPHHIMTDETAIFLNLDPRDAESRQNPAQQQPTSLAGVLRAEVLQRLQVQRFQQVP